MHNFISLKAVLIAGVISLILGVTAIVVVGNANAPGSTLPATAAGPGCHVLNNVTISVREIRTSPAPGAEPDGLEFWFSEGDEPPCIGESEDGCWLEVAVPVAARKLYPPGRRYFIPTKATNSARKC